MKIHHISDSHGNHDLIKLPNNIDIIIYSGDFSNNILPEFNEKETIGFLHWFSNLNIKYKILVSGNHDTYSFKYNKEFRKRCQLLNIIYLENEYVNIENITIFGSPTTPTFGDKRWVFTKSRDKLHKFWSNFTSKVDILVTHGPPKNILDLTINRDNKLEVTGDKSLYKHITESTMKPQLHCFGHIHNCKDIVNSGIKIIPNCNTIFSNGVVVEDGKMGKIISNGNTFYYKKYKILLNND